MQVSQINWSETEETIAKRAFETAYQREISALLKEVRELTPTISDLDQLWHLHDFLSARRHDIDGKYAYEDSTLVFAFAKLLKEGWLNRDELKGLDSEKLSKISALARM
ncbi:MAG: hypothetical protein AAGF26_15530 [Cyanobacteria bacterium P01_G01_bin.49]